jgi:hypothetical protein
VEVRTPDFAISNPIVPASGVAGVPFDVSFTVTNIGNGAGYRWVDSVRFSTDAADDPFDPQIGYVERIASTPAENGSTYNVTITVTPPTYIAPGDYFLHLTTNDGYQREANTANNRITVPFHLNGPDLAVTSIQAPGSAVLGSQIAVSWTVTNQGAFPATPYWGDEIFLSSDPTSIVGALDLTGMQRSSSLAAGGSYTQTANVTIPSFTGVGNRYLIVWSATAFANQFGDANLANNFLSIPIALTNTVDLTITSATIPATASLGDAIPMTWTVKNQGTSPLTSSWNDAVYFSDNPVFDANAKFAGSFGRTLTVAAGASYTLTEQVFVPIQVGTGARYVYIVADQGNQVAETDETNNRRSQAITLIAPDVTVSDATAPEGGNRGTTVQASFTVTNSGPGDVSTQLRDGVYLSTDTTWGGNDLFVSDLTAPVVRLASGASYQQSATVNVPTFVAAGNYYLLFVTDRESRQFETNETNNVRASDVGRYRGF